ncbi:MAG: Mur ligase domain-containing protein, partial [Cyanobacteria bacterium J06627_3]
MPRAVDFSGRQFHFIGVGGIGMSALAYVLAKRQLPVSGSDQRLTHITRRLQKNGVRIFWSQEADNIAQMTRTSSTNDVVLPQVVCS